MDTLILLLPLAQLIFVFILYGMLWQSEEDKKDLQARLNTAYKALDPNSKLDETKRQLLQQAGVAYEVKHG